MTISVSTGLRTGMLDAAGDTLSDALNDGQLNIYAGTPPADADASIGAATLLVVISDNSQAIAATTGLDFDAAAAGAVSKAAAQTWSGTVAVTGTAAFYRFIQQADTGVLSTTEKRIQGSISTVGADLNLSNTTLTSAGTQTIDAFSITMPAT